MRSISASTSPSMTCSLLMQGTAPVFCARVAWEERLRLRVADGGQRLALENEADRGGHRRFAFELRHSRHGHELGAVLMIEPGGYLDFLRLLLRRDRDAERMLRRNPPPPASA